VMLPVGISIFTFSLIFDRFSKSLVFIFTITTIMLALMLIKRGWEPQYTVAVITLYSGAFISNQIQQRKREFHQELEKQESRYASLVENMNDGLIYADQQWKIIQVSEQFCRISGYSISDLVGSDLRKLTAGNDAIANASQFFRSLDGGGSAQAEFHIVRKGEGVNAVRVNGAPYYDTTGQRVGSMVVYTDITSLKQTQELLKKREEGYRTFIDQSSIGIWRADYLQPIPADLSVDDQVELLLNTGVITECNDFIAHMYGYRNSAELIGRPVRDFYSLENNQDEVKTRELLGQFVRSGYRISNSESKERDRNGNVRYMLNNNIGIVEHGNLIRTWGVQADITERKNTERELQEAYKELDTFFYKASHDLKGPLASMMGVVYLGRMENKDPNVNRYFDMIETSVQRLDATLMDLIRLARTRKGASKLHAIGVTELVRHIMEALSHLPKFSKTKFDIDIPVQLQVHTDKVLLQSVLQNLIHNAINYSNRQSPQISIVATQNADTIEFRVADNGDGIAADVQPRIFDMFYRGHQDSNGSGLGLFIVKNALEKMHGTVRFQSDKGAGTTFIVTLPKRLPEA